MGLTCLFMGEISNLWEEISPPPLPKVPKEQKTILHTAFDSAPNGFTEQGLTMRMRMPQHS